MRIWSAMDTGQKVSAVGHLALIGWVMVGDLFGPREVRFEFAEVSIVTGEEYAALQMAAAAPRAVEEPPAPAEEGAPASALPPEPEPPQEAPPSEPLPDPVPDTEPVPEPVPEPLPTPPQPVPDAPLLPVPPVTDAGDPTARLESPRPRPRPAPRVAPVTAPAPPPEAEIAPEVREAPEPAEVAEEAVPVEEITPTAPEEAAPEIVTEAERPTRGTQALAPASSPRPRARPAQPPAPRVAETPRPVTPSPETPRPAPQQPSTEDAIAAALAEAMASTQTTSDTGGSGTAASGPPLTSGERDALRVAVQQCWNVGSLSTEALRTTVTVGLSMSRDGRPDGGSIRMLSAQGGSGEAARQAFEAARRAIVRCGASGFPLPADKYDHWREIEMTFNPESMRIR